MRQPTEPAVDDLRYQGALLSGGSSASLRYHPDVATAGVPEPAPDPEDLVEHRRRLLSDFAVFERGSDSAVTISLEVLARGDSALEVRTYRPAGPPSFAMLWVHGGAFAFGAPQMDDDLAVDWVTRLDASVVSPDYRLAPEHLFPAAEEDCWQALCWLREQEPLVPLVVGGASAGGGLALRTALRSRREGLSLDKLVLVYPAVAPLSTSSQRRYRRAPVFDGERSDLMWSRYLAGAPFPSPLLDEALGQLPPTLLVTGEHDPLRDEALELMRRLLDEEVSVQAVHFAGVYHAFDRFAPGTWPAQELQRVLHDFLARGPLLPPT